MTEPHAPETSSFPAISLPERKSDLASALAALEDGSSRRDCSTRHRLGRPACRAILTLSFVVLLIGGAVALFTSTTNSDDPSATSRADIVYSNAQSGACLNWPPGNPDKPSFVQCRADHMFEVAKPVGANDSDEACERAVRDYLGARYDPSSRFAITELSAAGADDRRVLCGLQLLGVEAQPAAFRGSVAELDQSRVWPVGTCLGIDAANRSTGIPVDCSSAHALEVTGAVNLTERFPGDPPAEANQRAYLTEVCTQSANAYLAPATLPGSGLALSFEPLSPASWTAGSRQVSCTLGRPREQGWTPAVGSARTPPPADVPAAPPPSAPEAPPPPVYQEPLIPIGPLPPPAAPPPPPPPAPAPAPAPASPPPTTSSQTTTSPSPPPPTEPTPTTTETAPDPNVILLPGLPPIYLPGYVPPPPEPVPTPSGPLPGPTPAQ